MARTLKLMLVKAVPGLGELGEIVKVRSGYARNHLVPRKLAAPVTDDAVKRVAAERKRDAREAQKIVETSKATQELLRSVTLHIEAKAGEGGHLFGSVSAAMIAEALEKQGVKLDASAVNLENPIKELGIYTVTLKLHADVTGIIKVYVVAPAPEKPEKTDAKGAKPDAKAAKPDAKAAKVEPKQAKPESKPAKPEAKPAEKPAKTDKTAKSEKPAKPTRK